MRSVSNLTAACLCLIALAALTGVAHAGYDPAAGFDQQLPLAEREAELMLANDGPEAALIRPHLAASDMIYGLLQVRSGSWRNFEVRIDSTIDVGWMLEYSNPAAADQPLHTAWNPGTDRILVALVMGDTITSPPARRLRLESFRLAADGNVSAAGTRVIGDVPLGEGEIFRELLCEKFYLADIFATGTPVLVVPWSAYLVDVWEYSYAGVEVLSIGEDGALSPYGSPLHVMPLYLGKFDCTLADHDTDGKWELQVVSSIMPSNFDMGFLIRPRVAEDDWELFYDPALPFYSQQQAFYDEFVNVMLKAATLIDSNAERKRATETDEYSVMVAGGEHSIDYFVVDGQFQLNRVISFQQGLVVMQALCLGIY